MTTATKGKGGKVRQRPFYVIRRYFDGKGHTAYETVAECANITQAHIVARRLSRQRTDGVFNVKNRKTDAVAADCLVIKATDQEP
tara:strand:- start:961 stop:1215 length:255 start_codon:yes stop_codon:yes gene_type:complete